MLRYLFDIPWRTITSDWPAYIPTEHLLHLCRTPTNTCNDHGAASSELDLVLHLCDYCPYLWYLWYEIIYLDNHLIQPLSPVNSKLYLLKVVFRCHKPFILDTDNTPFTERLWTDGHLGLHHRNFSLGSHNHDDCLLYDKPTRQQTHGSGDAGTASYCNVF